MAVQLVVEGTAALLRAFPHWLAERILSASFSLSPPSMVVLTCLHAACTFWRAAVERFRVICG
jgi:hypothetical protein